MTAHFLPILATVLLSVMAGCATTTTYERPQTPLTEKYNLTGLDLDPSMSPATKLGWREYFLDSQLQSLIARTLENNRDMRVAMARVQEARALYGIQRADQLPTISAGAQASRSRVPADLSITGSSLISSQYQATLNLSTWELDFWGRVRNLKEAALESYLASTEAARAIRISLVAQVANLYLLERELDERLATARQALLSRGEAHRIMSRRYQVGATSKLDATQTELLLNQAGAELTILERQREQAHNALTLVVGTPQPSDPHPLSKVEAGFVRDITPGLPSDLLLDRPDVLAAEHGLKAAHANIAAARAAFFPRISLTAGLGTGSAELSGLFGSDSQVWNFVPSLSLPLFDAGRIQANVDLAEARKVRAVAEYEQTVQGAFREVADALADRRWLARQVKVQRDNLATQTERVRLSELRYMNGAAAYLEVLDAERDRFAAEQVLAQTRRALLASAVNLYAALGGGDANNNGQKRETQ